MLAQHETSLMLLSSPNRLDFNICDLWYSLFTSEEPKTIYLSIVQLDGLAVYVVWVVTFLNMMA